MVDLRVHQHLLLRPDGSFEMVRSEVAGDKLAEAAAVSHGSVIGYVAREILRSERCTTAYVKAMQ